MTMTKNKAFLGSDGGAGNATRYEPFRFRTRHAADAAAPWFSPTSSTTRSKTAWQDTKGASSAGGIAAQDWNNTVFGGKFPASKAAVFTHLMVFLRKLDAVLTEAQQTAFLTSHQLILKHQGIDYDLGLLIEWVGPVGTSSQRPSNVVGPRPLPAPFQVNANEEISWEVRCVEAVNGLIFASGESVDVCGVLSAETFLKDAAVIKQ